MNIRPVKIVHLYPKEMNIYGDTGNRLVIEKRLAWRDIPYETHLIGVGDSIPKDADILIGGGGQDASQDVVADDLQSKKDALGNLAAKGVPMLMVCGMYQLLGRRFVTGEGAEIRGIGILPVETIAKPGRLIGNIHATNEEAGLLIGYENHSGRTYLEHDAVPFARVVFGSGNNDESGYEGCRIGNVLGTYMHGPILSKNPQFADLLIHLALQNASMGIELKPLDDQLIEQAREAALKRPR